MQDTCLPQNYVNCIGKVKVCGCRRFRESVLYGQCLFCSSPCLPLSYFLLVRLSCSFPPEVLSRISFPPFAFCYPVLRCSSLRYRPSVFHSLFYALLFFPIIMYAHVCGCGSAASFASLQVCLPFFSFSVFSGFCLRIRFFLFPFFFTRVRIL